MKYYFDMDGTIANLYGVENWLEDLIKENTRPYKEASPLCSMEELRAMIMKRKAQGDTFGVISWTSKGGSKEYNKAVRKVKIEWLNTYLPDCFDEIHIVKYGTPKYRVAKIKESILFDDEEKNRNEWRGIAKKETEIFSVLTIK